MNKKLAQKNRKPDKQVPIDFLQKSHYKEYILAGFCFLFAFVLYSHTFKHQYVLDDYSVLADNWLVKKGVEAVPTIFHTPYRYGYNQQSDNLYRPLSLAMFAIEWQLSPNNPSLNHFINVLFYALSCFLLFMVLRKYLNHVHSLIPLLIVLLFASHPIHTEVVANIKSRDEIMSFFFLMLTFLFLHSWFSRKRWVGLILSLCMFFLAFLSKEGLVTVLFLFPLLGWYFTEAKPKTILTASILLCIPAIIYIYLRSQIITDMSSGVNVVIADNFLIGAPNAAAHFATAIMLLGKYLLLLIVPYQLVCDYSINQIPIVGLGDLKFILSIIVYGIIGIYAVWNIRKKSPLVFGILFFMVTLSIYSNLLFHIGSSFAERFMFLPSLGICVALVFLLTKLFKVDTHNSSITEVQKLKSKPFHTTLCFLVIIGFSYKTIVRAAEWKDQATLTQTDIQHCPNSIHLCLNWGIVLREKGMNEEDTVKKDALLKLAVKQFEKARAIDSNYIDASEQLGLAWYLLKDSQKAMTFYDKAIRMNPLKAETWNNIGIIYFEQANYVKAKELYEHSLKLNPYFSDAYQNLGSTLGALGRYDEAIVNLKKCVHLDPNNILAHKLLALTYQNMNNPQEAQQWTEKAQLLEQKEIVEK
ncbi:MAG: tetratricopeptide repeat protein [Bacteroidota bacterium]